MRAMILAALAISVAVTCALGSVAMAQGSSAQLAAELGTVLGAEAGCKLKYDQQAIKAYIEAKVKADDMRFPLTLQTMSEGTAYRFKDMTESEKTAFCLQVSRIAKANKFTRD